MTTTNPGHIELAPSVSVVLIDTPSLGDRSYLVSDGQATLVVDPQRDFDRVLEQADRLGVGVTHVAETHLHNDYVTGGLALARQVGAAYLVPAAAEVEFERVAVADGDRIEVSPRMALLVIATPGHTFHHVAYALEVDGETKAVFSGGSMLHGSVGRTDLVGPEHTQELTRAQFESVRRLSGLLPAGAAVLPTHGFGSFCSASPTTGTASTIELERRSNPALTQSEVAFVESLLAGLDAYPAYYQYMGPANAAGPAAPDLALPERVGAAELRDRISAGQWVVDLRPRSDFAAGHLEGSYNFGVDGSVATYLGWLAPWRTPVTLIGVTPEQVAAAQRDLSRIGWDRPAGAAVGEIGDLAGSGPLAATRRVSFADVARQPERRRVVLDVRRNLERQEAAIPGSLHIPLHELPNRLGEVPPEEVWVHCHSGYRAAIAASLLERAGRHVVLIDDDFASALSSGLARVA
jgi:hydroxyacylglutathione hydrolase